MSDSVVTGGKDVAAQLYSLRDLTAMTGALHEAQLLQLRCWPKVVAPNSKSCRIEIDQEGCVVNFLYKFGKFSGPKADFEHWCEQMFGWAAKLLGPRWQVRVSVNGKLRVTGGRGIEGSDGVRTHQARDPATAAAAQ